MSTGGGFSHRWGRNGEFCVAVSRAIRTDGIPVEVGKRRWLLIQVGNPDNGLQSSLIGSYPRRLNGPKGDELPRDGS